MKRDLRKEKERLLGDMEFIHALDPTFIDEDLALSYSQCRLRVEEITRSLRIIEHGPDFQSD